MSLNNFRTLNECNTENACNVNQLNEVIRVFTLQNKSSPCYLRAVAKLDAQTCRRFLVAMRGVSM